jgi:hypothetical protein
VAQLSDGGAYLTIRPAGAARQGDQMAAGKSGDQVQRESYWLALWCHLELDPATVRACIPSVSIQE